ncbi:helix-turn-helix domain-containing protein [Peribacillus glennii]|uniref:XRE family transcriptional regulator n=1 Tax=Peribacillus glennii TaxID=2303991 RepID=A0A372L689_9BACI|nr:XRE family transcriptional regulator [Peribacillus glennii]RFU60527.1 XRE family transcriptional regulator [Peribacillus glennii]
MDATKAKGIRYYLEELQEKFARRIGVSSSTICAVEQGQRDITDKIRAKLVRIEAGLADDFFVFYEKFKRIT